MFERVLVPLDGSAASECAIPLAARLAPRAHFTFLRAIDLSLVDRLQVDRFADPLRQGTQEQLETAAAPYADKLGSSTCRIEFGHPADVILRESADFDLIAMTSHGRTGWQRFILGSVAEKVIRASDVPVLVVRNEAARRFLTDPIRHAAVTLDGFATSEASLPLASRVSRELKLELQVVHVMSPPEADSMIGNAILSTLEKLQGRVNEVHCNLNREGVRSRLLVKEGDPAEQIIEFCKREPIDLLFMATHGRQGIGRWLIGSVTEHVLRVGECPMLVIRSKST